jgi:SAM-dependent methyltransferase
MSFAQSIFRKGADYVDLQWGHTIATLKAVAPLAHGRLLDVGCGTKPYEELFTPFVTEYIGVEYTDAFETTHASQNSSKVDVFYSGERLPFDDASFDTVLSVQVLEHTPTPGALSAEIGRVLRDHGTALIMAPFSFRLHEEPNDFFRYTPHGLTTLLNAAELDVTKMIPMGGLWSGKCSHENSTAKSFSLGSLKLPLVAPAMFATAWSARRLDSLLPDPTESLGYLAVAKRRAR